jgi:hypothetical protein
MITILLIFIAIKWRFSTMIALKIIIMSIIIIMKGKIDFLLMARRNRRMPHQRFAHTARAGLPPSAFPTDASEQAFMVCPVALVAPEGIQLWQQLFERAYREAQAVVRPSILERLQAAAIN